MISGASSATNSEAGEISTAVRPDGTTCSPKVMSRNGAATATPPRISAHFGRSFTSCHAGSAIPRDCITTKSTSDASRPRAETIIAALKPSRAYLIRR